MVKYVSSNFEEFDVTLNLQAIWGLGNVAGDSIQCRDFVLNSGAFIPLLHQLNNHATLSILRNATWTLSNFFRGKPSPPFDLVFLLLYFLSFIGAILKLMKHDL